MRIGCAERDLRRQDAHGNRLIRFRLRVEAISRTIVKRPVPITVALVAIFTLFSETEVAESGPFHDFFKALRGSIAPPEQKSRPHRSSRKEHNETPPSDAANNQSTGKIAGPPDGHNVRVAKAPSAPEQEWSNLPYGTPVVGKQGLVTSPFSPENGYIDVHGFPPGTPVKDPYTGKIFLTP